MHKLGSLAIRRLIAALSLMMVLATAAWAQDLTPVRAATFPLEPFVMKDGDQLTGFSIELWDEIAARLKLKTTYNVESSVDSLIKSVQSNNADIAVSALFYTTERDKIVDFSYPILEAGLQVMVRGSNESVAPTPLRDMLNLTFSWSALMWLAVALIIILVPAHILWFLDRGSEDSVSPSKSYFPGIFHVLVWATTALVSQVQQLPGRWFARILGLLWMFAGVVFISLYTAQLTATLTVEQIQGAINGPADLPGKQVATLSSSTSVAYLRQIKAKVQEYPTVEAMYQALQDGKAEAVVFGAASLAYYAAHEGQGLVKLVGPEVNKNDVGFVFPLGSKLRRNVGTTLIALREDGTYQRIYDKWFGTEQQ
jgi:polar amino acid transport system substrate-binding protein